MVKPHRNDISIGKDEWITFVDVDGRQASAADIDPLLAPMEDFWRRLETECVAACCGVDAFGLWPEDIQRASAESGDASLQHKLSALRAFIAGSEADCFISRRLNNYFDRSVILQLLDHIAGQIRNHAKS